MYFNIGFKGKLNLYSDDATLSFKPDQSRLNHFVKIVYELFGPERLFWGSDWPVSLGLNGTNLTENIEMYKIALKTCNPTDAEFEAIFEKNGRQFYQL